MVWTLPCVHSPCLAVMYSLKGCFPSPSKQKLGEGLAKLRTVREAPADCVCPPGECQGTSTATPPRGCLPAAHTTESPLLLYGLLFLQENVLRCVFPELKHSCAPDLLTSPSALLWPAYRSRSLRFGQRRRLAIRIKE